MKVKRGAKQQRGEATRERLLEAATHLIGERGFAATSVAEVCQRAGTVITALYWHFGSKLGLLGAVVERVGYAWIEEIDEIFRLEHDPRRRLDSAMAAWHGLLAEQPPMLRLLVSMALEQGDADPEIREAIWRMRRGVLAAIVRGLESSLGEDVPDLELVAETMVGLLEAALLARVAYPDAARLDRIWSEFGHTVRLVIEHRLEGDRGRS